jgi:hypothetical protein
MNDSKKAKTETPRTREHRTRHKPTGETPMLRVRCDWTCSILDELHCETSIRGR